MADVHLHDVYATLDSTDYQGVWNPKSKRFATIRTMGSQLHSTRIFNENYFAFLAALDDIASRGIHYVVMPGDFSDDGQPMNIRALRDILNEYRTHHDITFLLATGNHDPVRPFNLPAGKRDFLGTNGQNQVIMSKSGLYTPTRNDELPVVLTPSVQKSGYHDILSLLGEFGFYPNKDHLYWSCPFANYDYESYTYDLAQEQSALEQRQYAIASPGFVVPDVSYVCEPVEGVWFLSIDANVYIPKPAAHDPEQPQSYGSASTGYNHVLSHKRHLITWVKKIVEEAKRLDKTLIPFSHYPMVDFYDEATGEIRQLFGQDGMQLHRIPSEEVAQLFAKAGLTVHFGGHMHINDTGIRLIEENSLVNVQIPSIAAYIPGYKIATLLPEGQLEIETITLDTVPRFDELFALYQMEYDYMKEQGNSPLWDRQILEAKSYIEYTEWHLKQLIAFRFVRDWPEELKNQLLQSTGLDLLYASQEHVDFDSALSSQRYTATARQKVASLLAQAQSKTSDWQAWTGYDLILDFYRLRSADELAFALIGEERLAQYELLYQAFDPDSSSMLHSQIYDLLKITHHFTHGAPADHFKINLRTGALSRINDRTN
ncbi:metallophosphoesterase [Reichenbachiella sp. 5M10]|uniref:metallophosphoesterase family protein n=1 Tax=Reichenbachiella sp. 5M10 TaxID=1889772 RepID=UPI001C878572|nr:metallophosphoesterase [Reichenbachiella sp. 5M10]